MAVSTEVEISQKHPTVLEQFPSYPKGVSLPGVVNLLDKVEAGIVSYTGKQTPGIGHGILVLRDVRDRAESESEHSEVVARYLAGTIDFQLRNNLHAIKLEERE